MVATGEVLLQLAPLLEGAAKVYIRRRPCRRVSRMQMRLMGGLVEVAVGLQTTNREVLNLTTKWRWAVSVTTLPTELTWMPLCATMAQAGGATCNRQGEEQARLQVVQKQRLQAPESVDTGTLGCQWGNPG